MKKILLAALLAIVAIAANAKPHPRKSAPRRIVHGIIENTASDNMLLDRDLYEEHFRLSYYVQLLPTDPIDSIMSRVVDTPERDSLWQQYNERRQQGCDTVGWLVWEMSGWWRVFPAGYYMLPYDAEIPGQKDSMMVRDKLPRKQTYALDFSTEDSNSLLWEYSDSLDSLVAHYREDPFAHIFVPCLLLQVKLTDFVHFYKLTSEHTFMPHLGDTTRVDTSYLALVPVDSTSYLVSISEETYRSGYLTDLVIEYPGSNCSGKFDFFNFGFGNGTDGYGLNRAIADRFNDCYFAKSVPWPAEGMRYISAPPIGGLLEHHRWIDPAMVVYDSPSVDWSLLKPFFEPSPEW